MQKPSAWAVFLSEQWKSYPCKKANPAVELAHDCCYPNIKQDYIILAFLKVWNRNYEGSWGRAKGEGKSQLHQVQDLTSE
jgi:hypothetical protein